jgi:Domain of Unknown Function (DUF1080)
MNRRAAVLAMLAVPLGARLGASAPAIRGQAPWTPLFNEKDLTGWDTWLGKPHRLTDMPDQPRNEQGEYVQPIGLNKDPRSVFSVVHVDGGAAIRISGETYGGLITRDEYENYHLRFDVRWGTKRWPPREQAVRDSGCCYHSVGPNDASYGFWMKSFEFQIQEGDCGDFYSLAGVIADAEAVLRNPPDLKSDLVFRRGSPRILGTTKRIIKEPENERPTGEWNSMDLYCLGQTSLHVVNGKVNMVLTGLRHTVDGREVPLTRGRIQFQSEAAEVFYRNVEVRRITVIPSV